MPERGRLVREFWDCGLNFTARAGCPRAFFGALLMDEPGVTFQKLDIFMKVMFAGWFGGWEIVLILAVVLILFGAKKLPELAKGLGTGIKEFKKATREVTDEIHNAGSESPLPPRYASVSQPQPPSTVPQTQAIPQTTTPPKV